MTEHSPAPAMKITFADHGASCTHRMCIKIRNTTAIVVLAVCAGTASAEKPAPIPKVADHEPANLEQQKKDKYDEIRRRLRELEQIWNERESVGNPNLNNHHPSETVQELDSQETESPISTVDPPVPALPTSTENPPAMPINDPEPVSTTDDAILPDSQEQQLQVTGKIDRYSLSTSLFASGQYERCLQTLAEIDLEEFHASRRHWLRFVKASCLRELGQVEAAQQIYRQLVNIDPDSTGEFDADEADWLDQLAAWWLDQINQRTRLEKQITDLDLALDQWKDEVHELTDTTK